MDHTSDPELQLLRRARLGIESLPGGGRLQHELQNAPLFTRSVLTQAPQVFQQRGLLGTVLQHQGQEPANILPDERIYVNTSAPCSAIVCGVQVGQPQSLVNIGELNQ
jgi:hypothetical protein